MTLPHIDADELDAWHFALAVVAELLLLGNSEDQMVYADVAGPEHWNRNAITVFVANNQEKGRPPHKVAPRLRIGDMKALWVWDGRFDANSSGAQTVWEKLWPDARFEHPQAVARRLAGHINLELPELQTCNSESSWGLRWSRMFAESVDSLATVSSEHPWLLQTSYRDGAGYYIHFEPCGLMFQGFYLNEAGYISCNRPDHAMIRASTQMDTVNIKQVVCAGAAREDEGRYMQLAIQPMISLIESLGLISSGGRIIS